MDPDVFLAPSVPQDACFDESEFVQKNFDADHFLQEHRQNVSLEKLRDDLGMYLKILRSAMIELINRDYADFVNLSSNLIGLDKAINNLQVPLGQLKEEVMQVEQSLEASINDMSSSLEKHTRIYEQRQCLHSLIRYHKSISKLKDILTFCNTSGKDLKPDILERGATEFNQLVFHMNRCRINDFIKDEEESKYLHTQFKDVLNNLFIISMNEKNVSSLSRYLRIYVTMNEIAEAENIVRIKIIIPSVKDIISEYSLQNDENGLEGIYQKLHKILDVRLKELLDITLNPVLISVKGFNFLVNSFWTEVEQRIEDYIPVIFAPGNPDLFRERYNQSLDFLLKLEQKYLNSEAILVLKNHPQYTRFLKKWNLPVYFQIRFQEIAGTAESVLSAAVSPASIKHNKLAKDSDEFSLFATSIIWDCVNRIWHSDVYLPQLLHKFWKLLLQLCSRYGEWCKNSLKQNWPVTINETSQSYDIENLKRLQFLVGLYTDIEKLSLIKLLNIIDIAGNKLSNANSEMMKLLNESLAEASKNLESHLPVISEEIVKELLQHSVQYLKEISDIPRLYRRTNRDIPNKPCTYVKKLLDFLTNFHLEYNVAIPTTTNKWLIATLTSLTELYSESVNEVLISVQKTEESLKRLKKIRDKSAGVSTSEKQGITDDEKIRLQLHIDILSYIKAVKELNIDEESVPNLKQLRQLIESAVQHKSDR